MVAIGLAQVELCEDGCFTRYQDGATYGAQPHKTPDYYLIADRLGYGQNIMRYCVEHEVCHHAIAEWGFGRRSAVLWPLAHGLEVDLPIAIGEECAVQFLQAYVQLGVRPIVGDAPWCDLQRRVTEAVDALYAF